MYLPLVGSEVGPGAAGGVRGRDRQQRDADDRDHRAGHDRREEPDQLAEERRDQEREEAGDDHRAVDRRAGRRCRRRPPAPIAIIGETAVNVTPCSSGSRTPTFQKPTDWMIEAMPQVNRSALIRWMSCSVLKPDGVGEQDRDDHRAGVEREHVLEAVDRELGDGEDLVDGVLPPLPAWSCRSGLWSPGTFFTGTVPQGYSAIRKETNAMRKSRVTGVTESIVSARLLSETNVSADGEVEAETRSPERRALADGADQLLVDELLDAVAAELAAEARALDAAERQFRRRRA